MKKLFLLSFVLLFSFSAKKCNSKENDLQVDQEIDNQLGILEKKPAKKKCDLQNFEDSSGNKINPDVLKGKLSFVFIWATWCPICKNQIPNLNELIKFYEKDPRIHFVSISVDQNKKDWLRDEKILKGLKLWSPEGFDDDSIDCLRGQKLQGVPYFLILDKKAEVYKRYEEFPIIDEAELRLPVRPYESKEQLKAFINEVLAQQED